MSAALHAIIFTTTLSTTFTLVRDDIDKLTAKLFANPVGTFYPNLPLTTSAKSCVKKGEAVKSTKIQSNSVDKTVGSTESNAFRGYVGIFLRI